MHIYHNMYVYMYTTWLSTQLLNDLRSQEGNDVPTCSFLMNNNHNRLYKLVQPFVCMNMNFINWMQPESRLEAWSRALRLGYVRGWGCCEDDKITLTKIKHSNELEIKNSSRVCPRRLYCPIRLRPRCILSNHRKYLPLQDAANFSSEKTY